MMRRPSDEEGSQCRRLHNEEDGQRSVIFPMWHSLDEEQHLGCGECCCRLGKKDYDGSFCGYQWGRLGAGGKVNWLSVRHVVCQA
jgi:hypothetical protein